MIVGSFPNNSEELDTKCSLVYSAARKVSIKECLKMLRFFPKSPRFNEKKKRDHFAQYSSGSEPSSISSIPGASPSNIIANRNQYLKSNSLDAVVQLLVFHATPNSGLPWQMKPERQSYGTGLIISEKRIITNAHCVDNASMIYVRKRNSSKKFAAHISEIAHDCDLAFIGVQNEEFWKDENGAELGDLPALQDTVYVVGYPTSGFGAIEENVCLTAGVVSRLGVLPYSHTRNTSKLMTIQIDAAINSGNSGGPAYNTEGNVVGIAFESSNVSENSGFLIPATVVKHVIKGIKQRGKFSGICNVGFSWQTIENEDLRKFLGMNSEETGVLISEVHKLGGAHGVLQRRDVVCEINGNSVGPSGTVTFHDGLVEFDHVVKNMFEGEKINLQIIRAKKRMDVNYSLVSGRNIPLVPIFEKFSDPEYLVVAGLVFVVLSIPYLNDDWGADWYLNAPKSLIHTMEQEKKERQNQEVIVLARVLACEMTEGYDRYSDYVLRKFNSEEILNLSHLAHLVENCTSEYYEFELDRNIILVMNKKKAQDQQKSILKRHSIPNEKRIHG